MIMSLDMSTICIGWAIFDEDNLMDYGKLVPTVEELEWRDRIQNFIPQLHNLMKKYMPTKIYAEDVPLIHGKAISTCVQLGAVQGALIGLCYSHNVEVEFIQVATWRSNLGLLDKKKYRDELKVKSLDLANKLFKLNLACVFTKSGNYNGKKSDDDISDAILVYASTRNKYKIEKKRFGRTSPKEGR